MKTIFVVLILSLSFGCSLVKSEGEREAQNWFDNTFVQCGEDYYTKYDGPPVFAEANMLGEIRSAILQFKKPRQEGPLLYSDKVRRDLDKMSPYLINFGKIRGKWIIPETGFTKLQCSELPENE